MQNSYIKSVHFIWPIMLAGAVALSSCNSSNKPYPGTQLASPPTPYPGPQDLATQNAGNVLEVPSSAPVPRPGKSSISGVIYSVTVSKVLWGTMFYLTPAVGDDHRQMPSLLVGPLDSSGDIRGYTDSRGQFVLDDIPPGNYYMIVSLVFTLLPAGISDTDFTPRLIELAPNQQKPLGIIALHYP